MRIEATKTDVGTFNVVVQAMIRDSSERWLTTKDRSQSENAIIICIDPPQAFILSNGRLAGVSGWVCDEVVLGPSELGDFFGAFGSSYRLWLESKLGGKYPVRAFIRDGQDEWNFSIDSALQR